MAEARVEPDVKAAFFAGLFVIAAALAGGGGPLGWLAAPLAFVLFLYAMARAPLIASLLVLMFCGLALENPSEQPAAGAWQSPIFDVGAIMLVHFKKSVGIGLPFSGMDVMLASLGIIMWVRSSSGSKVDRAGAVPTPRPLIRLAQLSLLGTLFVWISGLVRGGDNSIALWQVDRVFYVPIVFLLFQAAIRGPSDILAIGRTLLAAATVRACQAVYVRYTVSFPPDPVTGEARPLPYTTTHHDSILFAAATVLLAALVIQRAGKKARWLVAVFLPILVWGMLANQRRMVWVQILSVMTVLYFVTAMNPVKRKLQKALLWTSPAILAYITVGWSHAGGIFKPVATIRSAVDSQSDASTLWRDIENFDLIWTIKQNPIFGAGYGRGFIEMIPLPPVDYVLERYIPHNSILGLWAYCGFIGFTAITLLWVGGVYFSIRAYHAASTPTDKAAALVAFAAVPIYYLQCYGDMGLGSWAGVFLMGPALAVGGKLAVSTGAWPVTQAARRAVPATPGRRPAAAAAPRGAAAANAQRPI